MQYKQGFKFAQTVVRPQQQAGSQATLPPTLHKKQLGSEEGPYRRNSHSAPSTTHKH